MKSANDVAKEFDRVKNEFKDMKVTNPTYDDMASRFWTLVWVLDVDVKSAERWLKQ